MLEISAAEFVDGCPAIFLAPRMVFGDDTALLRFTWLLSFPMWGLN
jgi:hypothetical protein